MKKEISAPRRFSDKVKLEEGLNPHFVRAPKLFLDFFLMCTELHFHQLRYLHLVLLP